MMMQPELFERPDIFKDWLMQRKGQQGNCPCCGRYAKIYKRRLNSTMAKQLIRFYHLGAANEFVHTSKVVAGTGVGDFSKMRIWGLLKPAKIKPKNGSNTSGKWKLTADGVAFVENRRPVRQYAHIYLDELIEFSGDAVSIIDCLKSKGFNYHELMAA